MDYAIRGFGNLIDMDIESKNKSQFVDAVSFIACKSPNEIPLKLKVFTRIYMYVTAVSILVIITDEKGKKKLDEDS